MQLETWIFHLFELRFDVFLGVRETAGSLPTKNSRESVFRFFLSSGVDTRMTQFEARVWVEAFAVDEEDW